MQVQIKHMKLFKLLESRFWFEQIERVCVGDRVGELAIVISEWAIQNRWVPDFISTVLK